MPQREHVGGARRLGGGGVSSSLPLISRVRNDKVRSSTSEVFSLCAFSAFFRTSSAFSAFFFAASSAFSAFSAFFFAASSAFSAFFFAASSSLIFLRSVASSFSASLFFSSSRIWCTWARVTTLPEQFIFFLFLAIFLLFGFHFLLKPCILLL